MSPAFRAVSFTLCVALWAASGSASAQDDETKSNSPAANPAVVEQTAPEDAADLGAEDAVENEIEQPSDQPKRDAAAEKGWMQSIDDGAGKVSKAVGDVMFYDLSEPFMKEGEKGVGLAVVVVMLVTASIFFTVYMGFINIRAFKHAILVTAGKYDDPDDQGEVSHFQALTAALSATVGLGNIAGVAVAVGLGGPGAVLWMIFAGLLGMSAKFMECTLGQKYRKVRPDGKIMGGPMYYLKDGLAELNLGPFGTFLAGLFALLCVWASTMGGNAFQVKQSLGVVGGQIEFINPETGYPWVYGLVMTVAVGLVILGGITRIAATASKIVPAMCGIYVAACLFILIKNYSEVPAAFGAIFSQAFAPDALYGGFIGVLILGFQRRV